MGLFQGRRTWVEGREHGPTSSGKELTYSPSSFLPIPPPLPLWWPSSQPCDSLAGASYPRSGGDGESYQGPPPPDHGDRTWEVAARYCSLFLLEVLVCLTNNSIMGNCENLSFLQVEVSPPVAFHLKNDSTKYLSLFELQLIKNGRFDFHCPDLCWNELCSLRLCMASGITWWWVHHHQRLFFLLLSFCSTLWARTFVVALKTWQSQRRFGTFSRAFSAFPPVSSHIFVLDPHLEFTARLSDLGSLLISSRSYASCSSGSSSCCLHLQHVWILLLKTWSLIMFILGELLKVTRGFK